MARPDFTNPDFVEECEADDIQERMMDNLPSDISSMEGDFAHDFTMPTAIEISQLVQFDLVRTLMLAFPEYAWDEWLDLHGRQASVIRHEAAQATGYVQVTGEDGTEVEAGTIFCVPATEDSSDIEFESIEDAVLSEGEVSSIPIIAVEAGINGNVAAGTISIMSVPMEGIESITNEDRTSGGSDEEDDDAYYERIHEAHTSSLYFVGNDADYVRWAKEVSGIGDCIVMDAWDGPGTVKLVLVDTRGLPADETLVNEVYDHIVSPSDRTKRLLPTGCARLTVVPADSKPVSFTCSEMVLDPGYDLNGIIDAFKEAIIPVYSASKSNGILRYNDVRPVLSEIEGVVDFSDFLVNDGHSNVILSPNEYAVTGTVSFTER